MGYSFGKTLLKVLKNLGVVMALGALSAGVDNVADIVADLGIWAPVIALGLQMAFTTLMDYLKHK
jgi:hypothetical protein